MLDTAPRLCRFFARRASLNSPRFSPSGPAAPRTAAASSRTGVRSGDSLSAGASGTMHVSPVCSLSTRDRTDGLWTRKNVRRNNLAARGGPGFIRVRIPDGQNGNPRLRSALSAQLCTRQQLWRRSSNENPRNQWFRTIRSLQESSLDRARRARIPSRAGA